MTFFSERMGVITGGPATSLVIRGDVRVLSGLGPDEMFLRPGEQPDAFVVTTISGRSEAVAVSDFELRVDGMTHFINGSIASLAFDVFYLWGNIEVVCPAGEDAELVTETGEVHSIPCDGAL